MNLVKLKRKRMIVKLLLKIIPKRNWLNFKLSLLMPKKVYLRALEKSKRKQIIKKQQLWLRMLRRLNSNLIMV